MSHDEHQFTGATDALAAFRSGELGQPRLVDEPRPVPGAVTR